MRKIISNAQIQMIIITLKKVMMIFSPISSALTVFTNNKTLSFFILLFLLSFNITADINSSSNVVSDYLSISINVKTNVDCFTCDYISEINDTLLLTNNTINSEYHLEGGQYLIPIMLIDCHNSIRNSNLQNMLKVDSYPHILIKINSLVINKETGNRGKGILSVNIDGINRAYSVFFNNYLNKNIMVINGNLAVDLHDFSITPPSKFFGLVTVDKVININFGLKLKVNQL
jgi:hypothetical protein